MGRDDFVCTVYLLPCSELSLQRKKERKKGIGFAYHCAVRVCISWYVFDFVFLVHLFLQLADGHDMIQFNKQLLYMNDRLLYLSKCTCTELQKNANIWILKIKIFYFT